MTNIEFCQALLSFKKEEQEKFWKNLDGVISEEEIEALKSWALLYEMFENEDKNKAIKKTLVELLYKNQ